MTQSVSRSVGARVQAAGTLLVLAVALGLGALTDLGQAWLPQSSASLANSGASSGCGCVRAGAVRHQRHRRPCGGCWGWRAWSRLLPGRHQQACARVTSEHPVLDAGRGDHGPAAGWPRPGFAAAHGHGRPRRRGRAGLLGGESVYGLTVIAGSTSSLYWAIQLAVAIILLVALNAWRVREPAPVVLSTVTAAVSRHPDRPHLPRRGKERPVT